MILIQKVRLCERQPALQLEGFRRKKLDKLDGTQKKSEKEFRLGPENNGKKAL